MRNYVEAVMTGNTNGMDEIEKSIINFEINRLDQDINWTAVKNIDMEQVEHSLKVIYPKIWKDLLESTKLSAKVFMFHEEKTYRDFYNSLNEEEKEIMNKSLEIGIRGAVKIAG